MKTVRLTMAQALVRYLSRCASTTPQGVQPLFAGVFAIFGHGNVAGIGEALYRASRRAADVSRAQRAGDGARRDRLCESDMRRRMMACTTSIGPGATNLVTAAALGARQSPAGAVPARRHVRLARARSGAAADRGFPRRHGLGNDCFRPVSRYFDRIVHPAQLLTALPRAIHVLTDPALCGPVTLALPQDVQTMAFDYPEAFFAPPLVRFAAMAPADERRRRSRGDRCARRSGR